MEPLTEKEARLVINGIWGRGDNMSSRLFRELEERLPASDLPILDRLLSVCDLLDEYNRRGRPAFANFRNWWDWLNAPKTFGNL
jgi:hypothetical protein